MWEKDISIRQRKGTQSNENDSGIPRKEEKEMLKDKLNEWEQEMPEGLHEQLGACRYCGQTQLLHTAVEV